MLDINKFSLNVMLPYNEVRENNESDDDRLFTDNPLQLNNRKNVYCANCGEKGHIYKECKGPITSFGIIAFKVVESREDELNDLNPNLRKILAETSTSYRTYSDLFVKKYPTIKYLLIQRKDTMGYIDFIRGKYPEDEIDKSNMLKTYLCEMTKTERNNLLTKSFDELWDNLWVNHDSKCYKKEYEQAKRKFSQIDIPSLMEQTTSSWTFQEFGIPKGRRNMKEQNIACAEREFCEETGYSKGDYLFLHNYPTIQEEFTGTNGVQYRHVYYVVKMKKNSTTPKVDKNNKLQLGEVQNIGWFTFDQCMHIVRPYDTEKKKVLERVNNDLLLMDNNFQCSSTYFRKSVKKTNPLVSSSSSSSYTPYSMYPSHVGSRYHNNQYGNSPPPYGNPPYSFFKYHF